MRRPGESDADYYSRLDAEFEASPYTKAARNLAAHDKDCRNPRCFLRSTN